MPRYLKCSNTRKLKLVPSLKTTSDSANRFRLVDNVFSQIKTFSFKPSEIILWLLENKKRFIKLYCKFVDGEFSVLLTRVIQDVNS